MDDTTDENDERERERKWEREGEKKKYKRITYCKFQIIIAHLKLNNENVSYFRRLISTRSFCSLTKRFVVFLCVKNVVASFLFSQRFIWLNGNSIHEKNARLLIFIIIILISFVVLKKQQCSFPGLTHGTFKAIRTYICYSWIVAQSSCIASQQCSGQFCRKEHFILPYNIFRSMRFCSWFSFC